MFHLLNPPISGSLMYFDIAAGFDIHSVIAAITRLEVIVDAFKKSETIRTGSEKHVMFECHCKEYVKSRQKTYGFD